MAYVKPGRARISGEPIDAAALIAEVDDERFGGVVTFEGVVRRHSRGKHVVLLEYDAYPEMAERQMATILDEAQHHWPDTEVVAAHRVGRLKVGDIAVVVVAAAPHRAEAFAACRYVIDEIKRRVPIWKKEVADDGETWIEGETTADSMAPIDGRHSF